MAKIKQLTTFDKTEDIFPITKGNAVYLENGESVESFLNTQIKKDGNGDIISFPNNFVIMRTVYNSTLSHYGTGDGYNYVYTVTFPVEMKDTNYSVFHQPVVTSGHAMPSTVLGRSVTGCNVYCTASSSGSQPVRGDIMVVGFKKE